MHPESSISLSNETAPYRWSLLRLQIVFRDPESVQFPGRTNQRHFRFHKNLATDGETFAAGAGRRGVGRRRAAAASGTATCLQGDAQRDANADDPAARFHSKNINTSPWLQKYLSAEYRGRRFDGLLCNGRMQASGDGSRARDQ